MTEGRHVQEIHKQIEQNIPRLRRYARSLMKNDWEADDLVQAALVRALTKVHLWQAGTDLRAWLFTIMHNEYVNAVRTSVRQGVKATLDDVTVATMETQSSRMRLRDLQRALDKLPAEQRQVLLLVAVEDMKYEEVAEIVGVPVGTVRSRLSRGRDALRALMDEDPEEGGELKSKLLKQHARRSAARQVRWWDEKPATEIKREQPAELWGELERVQSS
jgi:RNA polymerase sigma-70 factor (ECF subfamily)